MISMNAGFKVRMFFHLLNQSRSLGNTQFLLYETSVPKWVLNQGETAGNLSVSQVIITEVDGSLRAMYGLPFSHDVYRASSYSTE